MDAIIFWIKKLVLDFLGILKDLVMWSIGFMVEGVKSLLFWVFDSFCTLIEWIFTIIDFNAEMFDTALAWANFPDELIWIINQVGIATGFTMISVALLIRVSLNLIPAALTRV